MWASVYGSRSVALKGQVSCWICAGSVGRRYLAVPTGDRLDTRNEKVHTDPSDEYAGQRKSKGPSGIERNRVRRQRATQGTSKVALGDGGLSSHAKAEAQLGLPLSAKSGPACEWSQLNEATEATKLERTSCWMPFGEDSQWPPGART